MKESKKTSKRPRGPTKDPYPLQLTKPWERLRATEKQRAMALGYTEHSWERNRSETLTNLWVHEEDEISFNGHEMPHMRVKLMLGDPARSGLSEQNSFCAPFTYSNRKCR